MSQEPVQRICVVCQKPMNLQQDEIDPDMLHEYSSDPCSRCLSWTMEGNYIFVSISNKSEPPHKINRTGYCWQVDQQEVIEELGEDHEVVQSGEKIIFVRHNEALALKLLTEEEYDELEKDNPEARGLSGKTPEDG